MRTKDLQDELAEGFEVGPLPPMGPDGALALEPFRNRPAERPRLCEAGPCKHYHRLEIQLEAQDPRAMKIPVRLPVVVPGAEVVLDGTIYRPPATFHTETHHTCYPDVGIEIDLGPAPVLRCNRWEPRVDDKFYLRGLFWETTEGKAHLAAVAAWDAARAQELADATEAEALIAETMAQHDHAVSSLVQPPVQETP